MTENFALVQPSLEADAVKIATAVVEATGGGETPKLAQIAPRMAMRKPPANNPRNNPRGNEDLRPLLSPLIQKDASKEDVAKAAKAIREHAAKDADARKRIGDIARRIIDAGKLGNYGTASAQEELKKFAQEFK